MKLLLEICFFAISATIITAQRYNPNGKCCEEYCFTTDDEKSQVRRFSTKTAYQIVKNENSDKFHVVPSMTQT